MAGALARKSAGVPMLDVVRIMKLAANLRGNSSTVLHFHVDNQAMAAVIRSGRNPTMRHLSRTHGISISWLHEQCREDDIEMRYITTTLMAADIYTKAFQDAVKWNNLCEQINLIEPSALSLPHSRPSFACALRIYCHHGKESSYRTKSHAGRTR